MQRSGRWVVVAGMLAAGVLGGCESSSDDPTPSPTPTPSASSSSAAPTSPSPTPSVTETGPEIPAAAREQTPAGAKAFVDYFFEQLQVAWTEPRAGLIKGLSDVECQFCTTTEKTAAYLVSSKQRYKSDPVDVADVAVFGGAPEGQQFLSVTMLQRKSSIVDASGGIVRTDAAKSLPRYVTLKWRANQWVMLEVEKTQ